MNIGAQTCLIIVRILVVYLTNIRHFCEKRGTEPVLQVLKKSTTTVHAYLYDLVTTAVTTRLKRIIVSYDQTSLRGQIGEPKKGNPM